MSQPKSILFQLRFVDLMNRPLSNLYHEIRELRQLISSARSDSDGLGTWISRSSGTVLNISIRHPLTNEMVDIQRSIPVPTQKGNIRIQAPFSIQTIKLRELAETGGSYTRKPHKVLPGETLYSIAKQYDTTWQILLNLNKDKIDNADEILPDQWIKIPPENSGLRGRTNDEPDSLKSQTDYTVKRGETLSGISQRSGVSVEELQRINGITDPTKLQIGQTIRLRGSDSQTVQPTSRPTVTPPLEDDERLFDRFQDTVMDAVDTVEDAAKSTIDWINEVAREGFEDLNDAVRRDHEATEQTPKTSDSSNNNDLSASESSEASRNKNRVDTEQKSNAGDDGSPKEVTTKLGDCSCNRELTLSELEDIFQALHGQNNTALFAHSKCVLNPAERNFESFTLYLNQILEKYDINTCIRRIHFLAQAHHESAYFTTTTEFSDGTKYNPGKHKDAIKNGNTIMGDGPKYKGRGLIQLTWKNNYKLYKSYSGLDVISDPSLVDESLEVSCDVSGWFWKQGKVLSNSSRWTGPSGGRPASIEDEDIDYPKTETIEGSVTYGTVDMNLVADNDKVNLLTYLINGWENGIEHRRTNVRLLKELFNYPSKCVSTGVHRPEVEQTNIEIAPWMEIAIREGKQWIDTPEHRIDDTDNYFKLINFTPSGYNTMNTSSQAWCAVFINYCLQETNFTKVSGTGDSYDVVRADGFRRDTVNFTEIDKPIYGAIACYMSRSNHSSHVALVIATHPNGTHFYRLGGNQSNHLSIDVRPISQYEFYVPTAYSPIANTQKNAPQKSEANMEALGITWHGWAQGSTR